MAALHEVGRRNGHVVAQIVETELIVSSEGDICLVSLAALRRVGAVLVDTVNGKTVEHIERSHPLGVTLGQIVVDGHHVHTVASQGIQEHRERSHERLTFTRCHLGNLTLMEHGTTEELHVVVDHVPLQVVTAGHPMVVIDGLVAVDMHKVLGGSQLAVEIVGRYHHFLVLGEAAGGFLHDAEGHGEHFVEGHFHIVEALFV